MNDGVSDIVVGRSQLSELDGLVQAWRGNGGDKARGRPGGRQYRLAVTADLRRRVLQGSSY